jgi:hypothetical protein
MLSAAWQPASNRPYELTPGRRLSSSRTTWPRSSTCTSRRCTCTSSGIARGLGKRGNPIAIKTCLEKLRSLDAKGCIKLVDERDDAPGVRVLLPSEMPGLIGGDDRHGPPNLDHMDFYSVPENRRLILEREEGRCFYCRRKVNESSSAFDHVAPRSVGNEGYRNVVASCRRCLNRKGDSHPEDLLRVLFREGFIRSDVLADRLRALDDLRVGKLKPALV